MAKLTGKISSIVLGDLVSRGFFFIVAVYLARVLGAETYGLITVAMAFMGYANWSSDLGLGSIGAREMSKQLEHQVFRGREILILKIVLATLVLLVITLVLPFTSLSQNEQTLVQRFSFSLIPYAFLSEWFFNGRQQFWVVALSRSVFGGVYFLLILWLVHSPKDLLTVPVSYAIGIGVASLVLFPLTISADAFKLPTRGWTTFKELLNSSFSIGIGDFFGQLMQFAPPLLIGFFLGKLYAGLYGAAFKVIIIGMLIDRVFTKLLLPNFTAQWTSNRSLVKYNMEHTIRVMLVFGAAVTVTIAILAPIIIQLLFGKEYLGGVPALSMLSVFLFFTFQNSIFAFSLIGMGEDRKYFKVMSIGGTISLILISLAAWKFDLWVVAGAVALGEGITLALSYYHFEKHIHIPYFKNITLTMFFTGLAIKLADFLGYNLWIETAIAILVVLGGLFATQVIRLRDLHWIKAKLKP